MVVVHGCQASALRSPLSIWTRPEKTKQTKHGKKVEKWTCFGRHLLFSGFVEPPNFIVSGIFNHPILSLSHGLQPLYLHGSKSSNRSVKQVVG